MNLRLQSEEVEIPEDAPFANDLLDREDSIRTLSRLLASLDGPGVVAVDAGWGTGKTTFLRMWAQYLRLEGVRVAAFNAWRTDFAREPFIALSSELAVALAEMPELVGRASLHRFKEAAGGVARAAALPAARVALAAVPGVGGQIATELSPGRRSAYRRESERYAETQRAQEEFRETLATAAAQIAAATDGRPLVIMIDELDRCRPTYAIELLELAKHLFDVDHVVFVLCLNRSQLAESVRVIYGGHFDASEYLGRFFDIDYRLPSPNREKFIRTALGSLGIVENIAAEKRGWFGGNDPEFPQEVLAQILDRPQLSLRRIQQTIQRLAVILASAPEEGIYAETLTVLLLLRMLDAPLYRRLVSGEETDENAVAVFTEGRREQLKSKRGRRARTVIEGVLCAAACLASADRQHRPDPAKHPLLTSYAKSLGAPSVDLGRGSGSLESSVVAFVENRCGYSADNSEGDRRQAVDHINFLRSVSQLELFPESLQISRFS